MDSLLANYASSDEEDNEQRQPHSQTSATERSTSRLSLFSSLPPPSRNVAGHDSRSKPSSLKTLIEDVAGQDSRSKPSSHKTLIEDVAGQDSISKPSPLFSSLPPPKPQKRLVEFKPPINYALTNDNDDDDDGPRRKKRASSNSSASASAGGLSAILPPPKNTPLGAGAGESGHAGRRSVLEIPTSSAAEPQPATLQSNTVEAPQYAVEQDYAAYGYNNNNSNGYAGFGADQPYNTADWTQSHGHGNWDVGASVSYDLTISVSQEGQNYQIPCDIIEAQPQGFGGKVERRGGRNQIPCDIIEVKQDELMSNRPREDQVKLTGIAFGPAYKPVSAGKDKPSKLHKRKHQIGSLYYELKQKEMELAERRARGHLTKAETQAKYGW